MTHAVLEGLTVLLRVSALRPAAPWALTRGSACSLCDAGPVVVRLHIQHLISLKGKFKVENT